MWLKVAQKPRSEIDEYISVEDKTPQLSDENSFSDRAEGNEISPLLKCIGGEGWFWRT